jgi:hypothetical protein
VYMHCLFMLIEEFLNMLCFSVISDFLESLKIVLMRPLSLPADLPS